MLRLDSLELIGFKSFAEKTRLRFSDGITCMIGPNGCGKSNVADAIGWVLGVHRASSLRGERMEDLIFAGTRQRKHSGFVQARVVFTPVDGQPPGLEDGDISGETLEIARKLYRDGESVYSINQRRCRLRDVQAALSEAGLGFASYALIAQGKIDWFLAAKPLDRRTIIEEAARIAGYKSRRRSAELKLELAQQNLLRVNDIVSEIERQLRSLKRQAGKARRYHRTKERFQHILRQKLVLQARDLQTQLDVIDLKRTEHESLEADLKKELAQREEDYRTALQRRDELEADLAELRQNLSETRLELDRTENSIQYHEEQVEATRKSLQTHSEEQQSIVHSLEKVDNELNRFQSECERLEDEGKRVEEDAEKQGGLIEQYRLEMEEAENRVDELRSRLVRLSAEIASLKNLREQLGQRLTAGEAARERLEKERSRYALQLSESVTSLEDARKDLERKKAQTADLRGKLEQQQERKDELEGRLKTLTEEAEGVHNQLIAQRERLQSLQEVELTHSQYSEGVQRFLKHLGAAGAIRTAGTLADCVETSPEYERLVEEFLDQELEYILVDSLDEARQGISELKRIESGKCTFLSLASSNGFHGNNGGNGHNHDEAADLSTQQGVYGRLAELLRMRPEIKSAFQRALPQRAEAIVVSNLGRAFELAERYPESTFITLEGESLASSGLLSASAAQAKKLGLLSLKRQKKELETRTLELQRKLTALRTQQGELTDQLGLAADELETIQESLLQLDKEIISLGHRQEQRESEEQRYREALGVVDDELARLDLEREQQREKIRQAETRLDQEKGSQTTAQQMLEQTQNGLQQLKVEFGRVQEQLHLVFSERKVLEERRLALERTLERIEEQKKGLQARRQTIETTRDREEERVSTMSDALQQLRADLQNFQEEKNNLSSTLEQKEAEHVRWKESYPRTEQKLLDLRERRSDLQERRADLEVERARLETQIQNLGQQCVDQLQVSLEEATDQVDLLEMTLEEADSEYGELKTKLEKFGPINLAALEEYEEAEERHTFLCSQRQDIEKSIADTTRAIQEINRRSRRQFSQAFDAINGHFNDVFQKLFQGGECGMRLLDENDPLESGIDLFAQPPGKKLQNVMLLSGGEKALTVFALLMAIFAYRPSRFCVLDEVDAPLDDANVARFTQLIHPMSDDTQFMIITHNKLTMEMADAVFGVTMEEPGISQIVSVKL